MSSATMTRIASNYFCQFCRKLAVHTRKCKGCLKVYYCDRICQKADWANHKAACQSKNLPFSDIKLAAKWHRAYEDQLCKLAIALLGTPESSSPQERLRYLQEHGRRNVIFVDLRTLDCPDFVQDHHRIVLEGISPDSQVGMRPKVHDALYPGNFPDRFPIVFAYQLHSHVPNVEPAISFHTIYCDVTECSGPIVPYALQLAVLLGQIAEERQSYGGNRGSNSS